MFRVDSAAMVRRLLFLVLLALLWSGCSRDAVPPRTSLTPDVGSLADAPFGSTEAEQDDEDESFAATDAGPAPDDLPALIPGSNAVGQTCTTSDDCDGGQCLPSDDGGICGALCFGPFCQEACESVCTGVMKCQPVPDQVGVACVPAHPVLCRPCMDDGDCKAFDVASCIDYGTEGRFCGAICDPQYPCPDGFSCTLVGGSRQCVADSGSCECRQGAIGAATTCTIANEHGSCSATRRCAPTVKSPDGLLTPCKAQTPRVELCDGQDDDCDGETDEDCVADTDGDGFGDDVDCVIDDAAAYPGAPEVCGDGEDQNCDDVADEGCDSDEDGTLDPDDCSPLNAAIHPNAEDLCLDGIDQDCTGQADEGCEPPPPLDTDMDGTPDAADCAPNDPAVHPGAAEQCNGVDDDCDGLADPAGSAGCTIYNKDKDQDGWGVNANKCQCGKTAPFTATKSGDCNDSDANVFPGALEVCNSQDDNCDGATDPEGASGCQTFFKDADQDGFGVSANKCLCTGAAPHNASKKGDCNDSNASIKPGAPEGCNGADDDCDGSTDEGACVATVCYPGVNNTWDVCFELVPKSSAGTGYSWPGVSGSPNATQYQHPSHLLDLNTASSSTKLAANFTLGEFMQSWKGQWAVYSPKAVEHWQKVRVALGVPLHINSGFRSPGYNSGLSGAATYSRHMFGDAADVTTQGATSLSSIQSKCSNEGADFTKVYTSHVHCDWRWDGLNAGFYGGGAGKPGAAYHLHEGEMDPEVTADVEPPRRAIAVGESLVLTATWSGFEEGTPWVTWKLTGPGLRQVIEPRTSLTLVAEQPGPIEVFWQVGGIISGRFIVEVR
ncbi:MAG: hypothetical protein ACI9WU_000768 [Myxococcota bacterium]|jgi:hypothetical protein